MAVSRKLLHLETPVVPKKFTQPETGNNQRTGTETHTNKGQAANEQLPQLFSFVSIARTASCPLCGPLRDPSTTPGSKTRQCTTRHPLFAQRDSVVLRLRVTLLFHHVEQQKSTPRHSRENGKTSLNRTVVTTKICDRILMSGTLFPHRRKSRSAMPEFHPCWNSVGTLLHDDGEQYRFRTDNAEPLQATKTRG